MKTFLVKIIVFLLPLGLIIGLSPLFDKVILEKNLSSQKKTLAMGDSHALTGLKDDNLINVAQTSETYFFTYHKLRKILAHKKVDTLILSFSPHNISYFQDEKTFALNGNQRYQDLYPRYFYSLSIDEFWYLMNKGNSDFEKISGRIFLTGLKRLFKLENAYIGDYLPRDGTNLDRAYLDEKVRIHFYNQNHEPYLISANQINYLDKILDLCKEWDIQLVLVGMPLHPNYYAQIPQIFLEEYNILAKTMEKMGANFLDYSEFPLPRNHYADGDHLNKYGAEVFTSTLLSDIGQ